MKKQTTIYLSESDWERLEKLMKTYNVKSAGKLIRLIIKAETDKLITLERQE